jgi:hypothetical protein
MSAGSKVMLATNDDHAGAGDCTQLGHATVLGRKEA